MKNKIFLLGVLLLQGCSYSAGYEDIQEWMNVESKGLKGRIETLPPAKSYIPVTFTIKRNPFVLKMESVEPSKNKNKFAPDFNRRKEALESHQLDTLKMTGFVFKDKKPVAVIKTKDGIIHYVEKGNYVGTNYGLIVQIDEGEITLEERMMDSEEWKLKTTKIQLEESFSVKK